MVIDDHLSISINEQNPQSKHDMQKGKHINILDPTQSCIIKHKFTITAMLMSMRFVAVF